MKVTRRLGGYYILASIGHGGMGNVYLGIKEGPGGFGKLLVLKVLQPSMVNNPELLAMFLDEGRIAARLNHPNVVQTYEVGRQEEIYFIVMEYLDGMTLAQLMRLSKRIDENSFTRFLLTTISEALNGLHHAHELLDYDGLPLHVVHRDATPQNIFVTYDGAVKVVDFGIAKTLDSRTDTEVGTFKGKLGYLPPEQVINNTVDRRADIYSIGVILWEGLTQRRLCRGMSEIEIMTRLTKGTIPCNDGLPEGTPELLQWITSRAMAPDPTQRYTTAREFQNDIDEYLASVGGPMTSRELADYVKDDVAHQRKAIQGVIDDQLRLYQDLQNSRKGTSTPTAYRMIPDLDISTSRSSSVIDEDMGEAAQPEDDITVDYNLPKTLTGDTGTRRYRKAPWIAAAVSGALLLFAFILGVIQVARGRSITSFFSQTETVSASAAEDELSKRGETLEKGPGNALESGAVSNANPVELTGEIIEDAVLTNDREYLLRFTTYVRSGVSLMIQKGTVIKGDPETYGTLVVQPGARIIAEGTREEPIVFTSAKPEGERKPGDWGGVIVLGYAPVNLKDRYGKPMQGGIEGISEGGNYGGDNPDDDSGILEFVRIEYAGRKIAPNNEINGLTLGGVGRFTRLKHVQVRNVLDDCFEFFGGTVDGKYLICHNPGDDGFDWDYGYTGRLQFILVSGTKGETKGSNGLEGDNDPGGTRNTPKSAPQIYNATLCGKNDKKATKHYGILVKNGTRGELGNAVITGFAAGFDTRGSGTRIEIKGSTFFENTRHSVAYPEHENSHGDFRDDDNGFNEQYWVMERETTNRKVDPGIPGCIRRNGVEYKPENAIASGVNPPDDDFFDASAAFMGAFRNTSDNWDYGNWVKWY